jgi:hypothetical protein
MIKLGRIKEQSISKLKKPRQSTAFTRMEVEKSTLTANEEIERLRREAVMHQD